MNFLKKIIRNCRDYGLVITLLKMISSVCKPFISSKSYLIYVLYLKNFKPKTIINTHITFTTVSPADISLIYQIEAMEEWLEKILLDKLNSGSLCFIALDQGKVIGFNLISLDYFHIPLLRYKRKLRPHQAFSDQITIHNSYRNKGIGKDLRHVVMNDLRARGINAFFGATQPSNHANIRISKITGFTIFAKASLFTLFTHQWFRLKRIHTH